MYNRRTKEKKDKHTYSATIILGRILCNFYEVRIWLFTEASGYVSGPISAIVTDFGSKRPRRTCLLWLKNYGWTFSHVDLNRADSIPLPNYDTNDHSVLRPVRIPPSSTSYGKPSYV